MSRREMSADKLTAAEKIADQFKLFLGSYTTLQMSQRTILGKRSALVCLHISSASLNSCVRSTWTERWTHLCSCQSVDVAGLMGYRRCISGNHRTDALLSSSLLWKFHSQIFVSACVPVSKKNKKKIENWHSACLWPKQQVRLEEYGRPKIDGELKVCSIVNRTKQDRWVYKQSTPIPCRVAPVVPLRN